MPTPEIIDRVRDLHGKLNGDADPVKQDVAKELELVLIEPTQAMRYARLSDKLLALEAKHPKLSSAIDELVGMLNAAGL